MKATGLIGGFVVIAALGGAVWEWRAAERLRGENAALRAQLEAAPAQSSATSDDVQRREAELQKLRGEAQELVRLRGEITQLRSSNKDAEKLRAENQQLRTANQQLRGAATEAASSPAPPKPAGDTFARESWTFAGYASPESALVSAIWAMREGNPKTYIESLSPDEQARMSQAWGNKTEAEVAAKHQSDVSKITSIRVVDRQEVTPEQVTMSIYIGGVDRLEKVSMHRVGNDWKFGGFIREPKK